MCACAVAPGQAACNASAPTTTFSTWTNASVAGTLWWSGGAGVNSTVNFGGAVAGLPNGRRAATVSQPFDSRIVPLVGAVAVDGYYYVSSILIGVDYVYFNGTDRDMTFSLRQTRSVALGAFTNVALPFEYNIASITKKISQLPVETVDGRQFVRIGFAAPVSVKVPEASLVDPPSSDPRIFSIFHVVVSIPFYGDFANAIAFDNTQTQVQFRAAYGNDPIFAPLTYQVVRLNVNTWQSRTTSDTQGLMDVRLEMANCTSTPTCEPEFVSCDGRCFSDVIVDECGRCVPPSSAGTLDLCGQCVGGDNDADINECLDCCVNPPGPPSIDCVLGGNLNGTECVANPCPGIRVIAEACGGLCVMPDQVPVADLCGVESGGCSGQPINSCVECNPCKTLEGDDIANCVPDDVASAVRFGYYPCNHDTDVENNNDCECEIIPETIDNCPADTPTEILSVLPSDTAGINRGQWWYNIDGSTTQDPARGSGGCMVGFPNQNNDFGYAEIFTPDAFPTFGLGTLADPTKFRLDGIRVRFDTIFSNVTNLAVRVVVYPLHGTADGKCTPLRPPNSVTPNVALPTIAMTTDVTALSQMSPESGGYYSLLFDAPVEISSSSFGFAVAVETDVYTGAFDASKSQVCLSYAIGAAMPQTAQVYGNFPGACIYKEYMDFGIWGGRNGDIDMKLITRPCELSPGCDVEDRGCDDICFSNTAEACNGCKPPPASAQVDLCGVCSGGDTFVAENECFECCADPLGGALETCDVGGVFVDGQCIADPCTLPRIGLFEQTLRCFERVGYDRFVHETQVVHLSASMDKYDYEPLLRNASFSPVTQFSGVDVRALATATLAHTHSFDYETHAEFSQIVQKTACCHNAYLTPAGYRFNAWGIPLHFDLEYDDGVQYLVLARALSGTLESAFALAQYKNMTGIDFNPGDFLGWRIVSLDNNTNVFGQMRTMAFSTLVQDTPATMLSQSIATGAYTSRSGLRGLESIGLSIDKTAIWMTLRAPTGTQEATLRWPLVSTTLPSSVDPIREPTSTVDFKRRCVNTFYRTLGLETYAEVSNYISERNIATMDDFTYEQRCVDYAGTSRRSVETADDQESTFAESFFDECKRQQPAAWNAFEQANERARVDPGGCTIVYASNILLFSGASADINYWYCPERNTAVIRIPSWFFVLALEPNPGLAEQFFRNVNSHRLEFNPILLIDQNGNPGGSAEALVFLGLIDPTLRINSYYGPFSEYYPQNGIVSANLPILVRVGEYSDAVGLFATNDRTLFNRNTGPFSSSNRTAVNTTSVFFAGTGEIVDFYTEAFTINGEVPNPDATKRNYLTNIPNIFGNFTPDIPNDPNRTFLVTSGNAFSGAGIMGAHFSGANLGKTVALYQRIGEPPMRIARCHLSNGGIGMMRVDYQQTCVREIDLPAANRQLYPVAGDPALSTWNAYQFAGQSYNETVGVGGEGEFAHLPADCVVYGGVPSPRGVSAATYITRLVDYVFDAERSTCTCPVSDVDCAGVCGGRHVLLATCNGQCALPEDAPTEDICGILSGGCSGVLVNTCMQCNPDGDDPTDLAAATRRGYYPCEGCDCEPVPADNLNCDEFRSEFGVVSADPTFRGMWYSTNPTTAVFSEDEAFAGAIYGIPNGRNVPGVAQSFDVRATSHFGVAPVEGYYFVSGATVGIDYLHYNSSDQDYEVTFSIRQSVPNSSGGDGVIDPLPIRFALGSTTVALSAMALDANNNTHVVFDPPVRVPAPTLDSATTFHLVVSVPTFAPRPQSLLPFPKQERSQIWFRIAQYTADGVSSYSQYNLLSNDATYPDGFWSARVASVEQSIMDVTLEFANCTFESPCELSQRGCDGECYSVTSFDECGRCKPPSAGGHIDRCGECVGGDTFAPVNACFDCCFEPGDEANADCVRFGRFVDNQCVLDTCTDLQVLHTADRMAACMREEPWNPSLWNETIRYFVARHSLAFAPIELPLLDEENPFHDGPYDVVGEFEALRAQSYASQWDAQYEIARVIGGIKDIHNFARGGGLGQSTYSVAAGIRMIDSHAGDARTDQRFILAAQSEEYAGCAMCAAYALERDQYVPFFRAANPHLGAQARIEDFYGHEIISVNGNTDVSEALIRLADTVDINDLRGASMLAFLQMTGTGASSLELVVGSNWGFFNIAHGLNVTLRGPISVAEVRLPFVGSAGARFFNYDETRILYVSPFWRSVFGPNITDNDALAAEFQRLNADGIVGLHGLLGSERRRATNVALAIGASSEMPAETRPVDRARLLRLAHDAPRIFEETVAPMATVADLERGLVTVNDLLAHAYAGSDRTRTPTSNFEVVRAGNRTHFGYSINHVDRWLAFEMSTFNDKMDPAVFYDNALIIVEAVQYLTDNPAYRLLIDVSDNNGGFMVLGSYMLRLLDPTNSRYVNYLADFEHPERTPISDFFAVVETEFQRWNMRVADAVTGVFPMESLLSDPGGIFFTRDYTHRNVSFQAPGEGSRPEFYTPMDWRGNAVQTHSWGETYFEFYNGSTPLPVPPSGLRTFAAGEIIIVTGAVTISGGNRFATEASTWGIPRILHLGASKSAREQRPLTTSGAFGSVACSPSELWCDLGILYQRAIEYNVALPDPQRYDVFPSPLNVIGGRSAAIAAAMQNGLLVPSGGRHHVRADCFTSGNVDIGARDPLEVLQQIIDELAVPEIANACGCADELRDCQGTCFGKAIDCPRFGEDDCDAADPQPCQMTDACGSCGASADSTGAYGSGQLVVEGWPPPQGVAVVADTW